MLFVKHFNHFCWISDARFQCIETKENIWSVTVNDRVKDVWVVTYVNDIWLGVRDLTQQRNKETGSEEGSTSRLIAVNILGMGIRS